MEANQKPKIAISSCLLGNLVRYDKNHCKDNWIVNELSKYVELVPICPEMRMGLGVPREEIHLYHRPGEKDKVRLKKKFDGQDLTRLAEETYAMMNEDIREVEYDGMILTKKSPSCGIDRVKTIEEGRPDKVTWSTGLFAKNILENFPSLPIIDSGRLLNKDLRENFLKSVFAHFRFKQVEKNLSSFQDFHKRYKYILMDHSPSSLKSLGQIVANASLETIDRDFNKYYKLFFKTMSTPSTSQKRCNTLQHFMGYFKKHIDTDEKREILILLEDLRKDIIKYSVILKYFDLLTKKYKVNYLDIQYYFSPYPKELKLLKDI
ncbi:conserved hypothetical protein [Halobacteriovorax marinus SJ]|uniref:DUF1722 domain-containing protein n=1 Tax=Halobacteriovorax marinus (strain ATCC BAA-682 / DSM 15412 / SJ) TaxID=862908 RepID=E1X658_HALMS|nr:DUF523 and DUF1722 domain-containing protein [Halobacteriovorax marinus]CBW27402.1 conserved hypothetical protein [Halobacteriovorax marinus SJ]